MLEFKFNQACPVYQVRVATFSFGIPVPSTETATSPGTRKADGILEAPPRFSITGYNQARETTALKEDLEKKDKEICSYKKTIETLSAELDELRSRVRDLEQAKRESACALAREREGSIARKEERGVVEELKKELSAEKSEKERLTSMLQEETDKVKSFLYNIHNVCFLVFCPNLPLKLICTLVGNLQYKFQYICTVNPLQTLYLSGIIDLFCNLSIITPPRLYKL